MAATRDRGPPDEKKLMAGAVTPAPNAAGVDPALQVGDADQIAGSAQRMEARRPRRACRGMRAFNPFYPACRSFTIDY